ncbi:MAG: HlyC/CorC family transporter [PS1 clade bacterium]|uniref:HlyC/CorC family transporter n=1 Tax=PS1 clade bacterium TaxID=2175152 RepID=A0A368E2W4_9PROT|nr:MAG: HlyC/CorC family transporter [PS1 clade bacterium]HAK98614.1 magnesium/cobalt efflux protein [Rhodobiaceae bacterium]HCV49278.1 magnesium/cobalt efflux protein [Rhodobiaceae bacterium]|tara:strand:- start:312 stop:1202 length:891 start_codon:yes stop_codon:yes gene_type:complete
MSSSDFQAQSLWAKLKSILSPPDTNLRESLEDVLEDEVGNDESLTGEELHMLRNLLGFKDVRVEDVMVPRADITAVDEKTSLEDLGGLFTQSGHSRLPVYKQSLDHPIGMVHIKDLVVMLAGKAPKVPLKALIRDILFAPPSMPALDLLLRMQASRSHMALVVDEYGGTDGLVTIEDLIEEIVGEIEDEYDDQDGPQIVTRSGDILEAQARLPIEQLEEKLGITLVDEDEDIDTLGGLVFTLAGRVPQRGEMIIHKNGIEFEVRDADPRRIKTLRIRQKKVQLKSEDDAQPSQKLD